MIGLAATRTGRLRYLYGALGAVAGLAGAGVGVFPMNELGTHALVALTFFNLGWIVVAARVDWTSSGGPIRGSRAGCPSSGRSPWSRSSASWSASRPRACSPRTASAAPEERRRVLDRPDARVGAHRRHPRVGVPDRIRVASGDGHPMKAKRRVVTATGRPAAARRTPTVRRARPTIVPTPAEARHRPRAARPASARPGAPRPAGARRAGRPRGRPRSWARAAEPDPRGVGHVRLRRRVRRRRRRRPARGDLLQGNDPAAADRQPDAARDRDAGRDAQLDRPPEPGRRRRHREVRRDVDGLARAGHRQRRGRVGGGLRRGRAPARRRPGRRRHRAQHLVPERRQGRAPVRHRCRGRRRGDRGRPAGHRPAAPREAVAQRGRHPADRAGHRRRRRRRAHGHQHAVGHRGRARSPEAAPRATSTAGSRDRRSSPSPSGSCTRRSRP